MPPFAPGSREQRQAFKDVRFSARETAFRQQQFGGLNVTADVDYVEALEEVARMLENAVNNIVPRVSRAIGEDLRGGESAWPVKTGYSRSAFAGTVRGIENAASYAEAVEVRGMPAERYVRDVIDDVVEQISRNDSLLQG